MKPLLHMCALGFALCAPQSGRAQADTTIRPFRIHVSDAALTDLRRRILATRWPDQETVADESQGVQLATMKAVASYWGTNYDWRKVESRLNALPQFVTTIDGVDIHFIHVRSKYPNALPVIITHGWPGSVIELLKVIGPLTDPPAHGGKAEDAFDVVIPSMPGYGFSGRPTGGGWDFPRMARAWTVLMKRLGYTRFVAQGGDAGALLADQMGVQAPPELIGIHTNMPGAVPADFNNGALAGAPVPSGLSADERRAYEQLVITYQHAQYAFYMASRPQTLTEFADSPVGLATFLIDHDVHSHQHIRELFVDGRPFGDITRDDILDNITLYWLTNTGISAARLFWENKLAFFSPKGVSVPAAVSAFPEELYQAPRNWAERAYPRLIYYNKLDRGGHFAAWEQPELFSEELRAAFRPLRATEKAGQ